jgi:hypothetical protein
LPSIFEEDEAEEENESRPRRRRFPDGIVIELYVSTPLASMGKKTTEEG